MTSQRLAVARKQRADETEGRQIPDDGDDRDGGVSERKADFQHARADAAGEIVLEEGEVLADDVPMALPADKVGHARRDRLVQHQRLKGHDQRLDRQNEDNKAQHQMLAVAHHQFRRARRQRLDQPPHEDRDRRIGDGDQKARHQQHDEEALRLTDEEPVEAQDAFRRVAGVSRAVGMMRFSK